MTSPIRTLIVDDEWMVRSMLRTIMDAASDTVVVGDASDGVEAVHLARVHQPDVVLMDIRMPRGDGLTATERMAQLNPPPRASSCSPPLTWTSMYTPRPATVPSGSC